MQGQILVSENTQWIRELLKKSMVVRSEELSHLTRSGAAQPRLSPPILSSSTRDTTVQIKHRPRRQKKSRVLIPIRDTTAGANRNDVCCGKYRSIPLRNYFTFDLRMSVHRPIESVTLDITRFRSGPPNQTLT
jgi:hypothetical protein